MGSEINLGKYAKKGAIPWNKGKKGLQVSWRKGKKSLYPAWNKGIKGTHFSPQTEFKKGMIPHNWKGKSVGYFALHAWINRKLGKALVCAQCFSTKKIEWANISGEYIRDLRDWMQLCQKCHSAYDKVLREQGKSKKYMFDKQGRRIF